MKKYVLYIFVVITFLLSSFAMQCACSKYIIYFAGELFDHKHLTGNLMLARVLESKYEGHYQCILPQDTEERSCLPIETRNHDIVKLMRADLAIFNFDGTELDSGTVVEFMIAKMLDIPAVVLRTDFRSNGDDETVSWNLMATGYPRTYEVKHNCWLSYLKGIEQMHDEIADDIHHAFEAVIAQQTIFVDKAELLHAYSAMIRLCGSNLSNYFLPNQLERIVQTKIDNGLYRFQ